ncbi:MAG: hydrogen peroxide-inducible genes activator [Pseudomonadota bacterium]
MFGLTIKHMRYFNSLVEHRHFGQAAEASGVSQPALSMQIKEMEALLGAPLFERGARRVALTGLGEALAGRIRSILSDIDDLEGIARAATDGFPGPLRLGIIPTIAPYLLPRLIEELNANHAGLDLRVRETQTPRLVEDVLEGRLDMAILALPVSRPTLTETPLLTENFLFVRPQTDVPGPVPSPEKLGDMQLLLLEEGHCFRDQALDFCKISEPRPRELMDGSSLSTLVQMVAAGIGVTLIPEMAVEVETRSASVALARFSEPQPSRTVGMIWRTSSPLADEFSNIAETVRRSTGHLNKAGASC